MAGRAGAPWGAAAPVQPASIAGLGRLTTADAGVAAAGGAVTAVPAPRACRRTAARGAARGAARVADWRCRAARPTVRVMGRCLPARAPCVWLIYARGGAGSWPGAPQHPLAVYLSVWLSVCLAGWLAGWLRGSAVLPDVWMMRTQSLLSLQVDGPVLVGILFLSPLLDCVFCLSVYLSICLSVYLSVCVPVCLPVSRVDVSDTRAT